MGGVLWWDFAVHVSSLCTASKDCQYVSTSPIQGKCADVNIMCVLAMRSIGCGRSAAKKCSGFMNLPNAVTYRVWFRKIDLADKQMKDICESLSDPTKDITDSGGMIINILFFPFFFFFICYILMQ